MNKVQLAIKNQYELNKEKEKEKQNINSHKAFFREVAEVFFRALDLRGLSGVDWWDNYVEQVWELAEGTPMHRLDVAHKGPRGGGTWGIEEFFRPIAESRAYKEYLDRRSKEYGLRMLYRVAGVNFKGDTQFKTRGWVVVCLDEGRTIPGLPRLVSYRRDDSGGILVLPVSSYFAEFK